MFNVGRICVKIAGRDAGCSCVIVQKIDDNFVLIDGQTRRRKCNVRHLEPKNETVELKENATHEDVKKALSTLNIEVRETKAKESSPRPRKQKIVKKVVDEKKEKKAKKKTTKKVVDVEAKEVPAKEDKKEE